MNAATDVCTHREMLKTIKQKILKGSLHVFINQIKTCNKIKWIKGILPELSLNSVGLGFQNLRRADKKTNTLEAFHFLKDKCHHIPGGRGFNAIILLFDSLNHPANMSLPQNNQDKNKETTLI